MDVPHFTALRDETANGPFSFFNPTTRRCKLPVQRPSHQSSQEDLQDKNNTGQAELTQSSAKHENEVRSGDVEQLFRTRDNRKGKASLLLLYR